MYTLFIGLHSHYHAWYFQFLCSIVLKTIPMFLQKKVLFLGLSFMLLTANVCQDINGGFAFLWCLNLTFCWRNCLVNALVKEKLYFDSNYSFGLMCQCLSRAIPSIKCFIIEMEALSKTWVIHFFLADKYMYLVSLLVK